MVVKQAALTRQALFLLNLLRSQMPAEKKSDILRRLQERLPELRAAAEARMAQAVRVRSIPSTNTPTAPTPLDPDIADKMRAIFNLHAETPVVVLPGERVRGEHRRATREQPERIQTANYFAALAHEAGHGSVAPTLPPRLWPTAARLERERLANWAVRRRREAMVKAFPDDWLSPEEWARVQRPQEAGYELDALQDLLARHLDVSPAERAARFPRADAIRAAQPAISPASSLRPPSQVPLTAVSPTLRGVARRLNDLALQYTKPSVPEPAASPVTAEPVPSRPQPLTTPADLPGWSMPPADPLRHGASLATDLLRRGVSSAARGLGQGVSSVVSGLGHGASLAASGSGRGASLATDLLRRGVSSAARGVSSVANGLGYSAAAGLLGLGGALAWHALQQRRRRRDEDEAEDSLGTAQG